MYEQRDRFGNLQGDQYDLARDGSMTGHTIVIADYCCEDDLSAARQALEKKGFKVIYLAWRAQPRHPREAIQLADSRTQLWILSGRDPHVSEHDVEDVYRFFMDRHGVYLWGDNAPYFADVNPIANRIMACMLVGDYPGEKIIKVTDAPRTIGIYSKHPIAKGLDQIYEGITISHLNIVGNSTEFMRSSDGNILATSYTADGRRALMDGGFTRLFTRFFEQTAGTARYVCNAACWLAGCNL